MVFVELSLKITPRVALVAFVLFFGRSNNAYLIPTTILFCLHWKSNGCINEPSTSGKQKDKKCWQTQLINGTRFCKLVLFTCRHVIAMTNACKQVSSNLRAFFKTSLPSFVQLTVCGQHSSV